MASGGRNKNKKQSAPSKSLVQNIKMINSANIAIGHQNTVENTASGNPKTISNNTHILTNTLIRYL